MREEDDSEMSGELGPPFDGTLVGVAQLRVPKSELLKSSASLLPLASEDVECHSELCAFMSPRIRVSLVFNRWSRDGWYPLEHELVGGIYRFVMSKSVFPTSAVMLSSSK